MRPSLSTTSAERRWANWEKCISKFSGQLFKNQQGTKDKKSNFVQSPVFN